MTLEQMRREALADLQQVRDELAANAEQQQALEAEPMTLAEAIAQTDAWVDSEAKAVEPDAFAQKLIADGQVDPTLLTENPWRALCWFDAAGMKDRLADTLRRREQMFGQADSRTSRLEVLRETQARLERKEQHLLWRAEDLGALSPTEPEASTAGEA